MGSLEVMLNLLQHYVEADLKLSLENGFNKSHLLSVEDVFVKVCIFLILSFSHQTFPKFISNFLDNLIENFSKFFRNYFTIFQVYSENFSKISSLEFLRNIPLFIK